MIVCRLNHWFPSLQLLKYILVLVKFCWFSYSHIFTFSYLPTAWHPEQTVDAGIYWLFTFEIGFYLHYMYGMMFLETKRKDFVVLMLHHILTIALIVGCYIVK